MFHPPIQMDAFDGECARSIALRYAARLGVTPTELLQNGLGFGTMTLAHVPESQIALSSLATLTGIDESEILARGIQQTLGTVALPWPTVLPSFLYERDTRRLCPGVMAGDEKPWVRLTWQNRGYPCDPETGDEIIERCPLCRKRLSWSNATDPARCNSCFEDLRPCVRTATSGVRLRAKALSRLIGGEPASLVVPSLKEFDDVPIVDLLDFLAWLSLVRYRSLGSGVARSGFAVIDGLEAAIDWRNAIQHAAANYLRGHFRSARWQARRSSSHSRGLAVELPDIRNATIRRAVRELLPAPR